MTIGGFDFLVWFHAMRTVFMVLTIVFFIGAIITFLYTRALIHRWHGAHGGGHGGNHGGHDDNKKEHENPGTTEHEAGDGKGSYDVAWNVEHKTHDDGHGSKDGESKDDFQHAWDGIKAHADSVRESEWKLSVIEADNLVDDVLKEKGYSGESMGERLMMIKPDQFMHLQDLWDAHKLRNLLVHDTSYQITHEQVFGAIRSFEKVLKELGKL